MPWLPLLNLENVSIDYRHGGKTVKAVSDISFSLNKSDRLVLLGPSGSGKSSLLKAIGGFVKNQHGNIKFNGDEVTSPSPDRMFVFQEFDQLFPWKTVRENIVFPMLATKKFKRNHAEKQADKYIEKVNLSKFADAYPHTLSGGMKQRVAIARAMAMEPEILLMDEPFAALDALTRNKMQDELLKLCKEANLTVIFVTHSIEEALVIGTRIIVLSAHPGKMRAQFDTSDFGKKGMDSSQLNKLSKEISGMLLEPQYAI